MRIEKLIKNKTPFAVIQYFEFLSTRKKETVKKYEILTLGKKVAGNVYYDSMEENELQYLKNNVKLFQVKHNTKDGKVYEFMDFKNELNKLKKTNQKNYDPSNLY